MSKKTVKSRIYLYRSLVIYRADIYLRVLRQKYGKMVILDKIK